MLSRGEYIFFLDSDDLITNSALEEIYTLAKNYDAEVVYCEKHYEVDANGSNSRIGTRQNGEFTNKPTLETENLAERIDSLLKGRFAGSTCFKSVRRDLIIENKNFFPVICPSEDDVFTCGLVFCAKKFLRVPNIVYIRRHSEGSVMRTKRTPQQTVNFWLNPVILGLKSLDDFMSRHEFFKANPQYRHAVLEFFINSKFGSFFGDSFKMPPFAVYEAIKQKFGDKLGDYDVLIPALCTALNTQQKISAVNQQRFNQFATQAQRRISELESEIRRFKE